MGKDAEAAVLSSVAIACMGAWDVVHGRRGGWIALLAGAALFLAVLACVWTDSRRGGPPPDDVGPPPED